MQLFFLLNIKMRIKLEFFFKNWNPWFFTVKMLAYLNPNFGLDSWALPVMDFDRNYVIVYLSFNKRLDKFLFYRHVALMIQELGRLMIFKLHFFN